MLPMHAYLCMRFHAVTGLCMHAHVSARFCVSLESAAYLRIRLREFASIVRRARTTHTCGTCRRAGVQRPAKARPGRRPGGCDLRPRDGTTISSSVASRYSAAWRARAPASPLCFGVGSIREYLHGKCDLCSCGSTSQAPARQTRCGTSKERSMTAGVRVASRARARTSAPA
eukprot:104996-Pleurochrysis_carterae.AAC.6